MRVLYLVLYTIISALLTVSSCKSKEAVVKETSMIKTKAVISELFKGRKYHCKMNESRDMQLCFGDDDPQGDRLRKLYAVYDADYNMLYGPERVHGTVSWSDDDNILIEILPRVMHREESGNQTKIKTINIRERR